MQPLGDLQVVAGDRRHTEANLVPLPLCSNQSNDVLETTMLTVPSFVLTILVLRQVRIVLQLD